MILEEFDEESFVRNTREEGYEDGFENGLSDGKTQKAIEAATNFLKMNLGTPEQISQAIGLPLEEVLKLKEEITAQITV